MTPNNAYDLDLSRPTRELVIDVATRLLSQGEKPAVGNVRAIIGKGSNLTIQSALNDWWKDLGQRLNALYSHPALPDAVSSAALGLWTQALREAESSYQQYRAEADAEIAAASGRISELEEERRNLDAIRKTIQGKLDVAQAVIGEMEKTVATELAHKVALENQVEYLSIQVRETRIETNAILTAAREETERIRSESAMAIQYASNNASESVEKIRRDCSDQIELIQEQFMDGEKKLLKGFEIERQDWISERDASQKSTEKMKEKLESEISRLRKQNAKMSEHAGTFKVQQARLEGQIEEITRQRDRLEAEMLSLKPSHPPRFDP